MDSFVGYGRVSRIGDRKDRLRSFEFQERDIRAAAASRGLQLTEIITDPDESGANPERAGLLRAIELVENGDAAGIVVAKLDRFSRDTRQALDLAARVHEAGGRIISFAENPDWTTPEGELQIGLVFAFAQYERKVKAASFDKSKQRAVAHGIPVHPRLPPGLRLVVDEHGNRTGVTHNEHAAAMRRFFELRGGGAGPAELADFLERHGIETSMGSKAWSKQAIYGLIRNRAYLGELRQGEHVNERAWEPIVDRATFEAAQRPASRPLTTSRSDHPDLLLTIGRCASCGYTLNATNTSRGRRLYRCPGRHAAGRCPAPARAYAADLEELVVDAFWRMAGELHARGSHAQDRGQVDRLRAELERAERALSLYRDDPDLEETVEAIGGMRQWRDGLAVRRRRVDEAAAALAREEQRVRRASEAPARTTLERDWPKMSHADRRGRLGELIDCVALLPTSGDLPLKDRVVVFAAGHGPADLPRRGFRERPSIRPIDIPARAGMH